MKFVVDIGNTLIKSAVFNGNDIIQKISSPEIKQHVNDDLFNKYSIQSCIISSVSRDISIVRDILDPNIKLFVLQDETRLPFKNKYLTPKTLGQDRIAVIAAASIQYPGKNVLVIDAGTSLTYDFINGDNEYLGGAISPGLSMRFKALNKFTAKLPFIEFMEKNPLS